MDHSEQINELAAALAKAQGRITGALKDSSNPFFKSKYADLAACWDACRAPLSENGLAVIQGASAEDSGVTIETMITHLSGQWISSTLRLVPKDSSPQGIGSGVTYGRRYGLAAMVGIAQIDDDGNAASARDGIHRPQGDIPSTVPLNDARNAATAMRAILESDVEERIKTLKVLDHHDEINRDQALYIAASDQMSSKERAAWKKYVAEGKRLEKEDRLP